MKKYLFILACVGVSISVAAGDVNTCANVGDGQMTATQCVTTGSSQEHHANTQDASASNGNVITAHHQNDNKGVMVDRSSMSNTVSQHTSAIINGCGGRAHTPIKPINSDESSADIKKNGSWSHFSASDIVNLVRDLPCLPDGVGGHVSTDIDPVGPTNPGKGKGIKTVAGTCRNATPLGSENSGDNGNLGKYIVTPSFSVLDRVSLSRDDLSEPLGHGGRIDTPIPPFSLPNPVIPIVVSGSKGGASISDVTGMIDYLLTNGSSEDLSIEDVTSMIDRLLTE